MNYIIFWRSILIDVIQWNIWSQARTRAMYLVMVIWSIYYHGFSYLVVVFCFENNWNLFTQISSDFLCNSIFTLLHSEKLTCKVFKLIIIPTPELLQFRISCNWIGLKTTLTLNPTFYIRYRVYRQKQPPCLVLVWFIQLLQNIPDPGQSWHDVRYKLKSNLGWRDDLEGAMIQWGVLQSDTSG